MGLANDFLVNDVEIAIESNGTRFGEIPKPFHVFIRQLKID